MGDTNVLGIDIGGTKICVGIVTEEGAIVDSVRYRQQHMPPEHWIGLLKAQVKALLERNRQHKICGIGIGSRGRVDFKRQKLLSSTVIELGGEFDLCRELKNAFGLPVFIDNDVKAAACGELKFGSGRHFHNIVCYNIGTGIAAAVVSDGRLLRGKANDAGEIGSDLLPGCRMGLENENLEQLASGRGLELQFHERTGRELSAERILEKSCEGDSNAAAVVEQAVCALAASIVNLSHLLDPELFVFVGGLAANPYFYARLRQAKEKAEQRTGMVGRARMQLSELGPREIGVLGAASVALYNM